jgi:hypothetical protein
MSLSNQIDVQRFSDYDLPALPAIWIDSIRYKQKRKPLARRSMTWRDGELAGKQRALDLRNEVKEGGGGPEVWRVWHGEWITDGGVSSTRRAQAKANPGILRTHGQVSTCH